MCCFNLIGYFHTQEMRSTPRATTEEGRELWRWVYIAHAAMHSSGECESLQPMHLGAQGMDIPLRDSISISPPPHVRPFGSLP